MTELEGRMCMCGVGHFRLHCSGGVQCDHCLVTYPTTTGPEELISLQEEEEE